MKHNRNIKGQKRTFRQQQIEDGYFDGRFAPKKISDKRKDAARRACRKFKYADI